MNLRSAPPWPQRRPDDGGQQAPDTGFGRPGPEVFRRPAAPARPDPAARSVPPPVAAPGRDRPTEQMPRFRAAPDPGLTGPIQRAPEPDPDGGPATAIGLAPAGAEAWHADRTADRRPSGRPVDDDGGPPTQAAAPPVRDGRPGRDRRTDRADDGYDDDLGYDAYLGHGGRSGTDRDADDDRGPGRGRGAAFDDRPAGLSDDDRVDEVDGPGPEGRSAPGWVAFAMQSIAGAVAGGAVWVLFRFLWGNVPWIAAVVAVLVTVAMVLVVRHLMRRNDLLTTLSAVGVGLLLTASPAVVVALGR